MEAESMIKQENSNTQLLMDDDTTHVVITGPPASRTVIDNLKKLLTQRQHSRESDAENKEVVPSTGSDLESELSFYSLLTSSTSDSDLDFLHTSPDNRKSKRRPKRNLSTSSTSSSSSLSPVRERRKRPKTSKRGVKRYDSQMIILEDWNSQNLSSKKGVTPRGVARHSPISQLADNPDPLTGSANIVNINIMMNPNVKFDDDPENQSSSNKESTTDEEDQGISNMDSTGKNGSTRGSGTRLRKTRRDRNKRRRHYHHHHHHSHHGGRIRCSGNENHRHQLHNSTSNIDMIIGNTTDSIPLADIPKPTSVTGEKSAATNEALKTDVTDSPSQHSNSNTSESQSVEKII